MPLFQAIGMRLSPRMRGTIALSIPIFCTVTIFAAWVTTQIAAAQARARVEHTETVIFKSKDVLLKVTRLESQLRGYAIAGVTVDDENYIKNRQDIEVLANTVHELVSDNPKQQKRWGKVQSLIGDRFVYLSKFSGQQLISLPKQSSSNSFRQGNAVMEELRSSLGRFQQEERRLLETRQQRLERLLQVSMIAGWSLLAGSLLSSSAAVYLFRGLDMAHAEQSLELEQNQQLMAAIASSIVDGVITLNSDGTVNDLNRAAKNIFGYSDIDVQSLPLTNFLETIPSEVLQQNSHPQTVQAHEDQKNETHISHQIFETKGIHRTNGTFPAEVSVSSISVNQQQFLIVRDISERKDVRSRLEKYAKELETLNDILSLSNQTLTARNQELTQFAYLASHDLKAPLRAITNLSEWIEDDLAAKLTSESRQLFQLLRSRATRLEKLIDALAYYAQIGQEAIELEPVDVDAIVQEVIVNQPGGEGVSFELPSKLPIIQAHPGYLAEIFAQLIDNAVKFYQGESGSVKIDYQDLDQAWQFSVIDNGPGIEPVYHERIFEVFQTLQPRDQFESTGIGLSIVAKILMSVGGDISVSSTPSQGANFSFTWPKPHESLTMD